MITATKNCPKLWNIAPNTETPMGENLSVFFMISSITRANAAPVNAYQNEKKLPNNNAARIIRHTSTITASLNPNRYNAKRTAQFKSGYRYHIRN